MVVVELVVGQTGTVAVALAVVGGTLAAVVGTVVELAEELSVAAEG